MSYSYNTTGRSSSQTSIYDYPEHLNPFYEDENHKRLRFWNFSSQRSDKPRSERRGSLVSIRDGLRDMWEFKTFRIKKKRSSSLGVSKTSESPPPLRRDDHDSHYHTIGNASAYRSTINTVGYRPGYSQSSSNTPLFERNTRYRGSLQNNSNDIGIGLSRNDRYRSTIQNGFATYSGGSMVTSTPRSRYAAQGTTRYGMNAGVPQSSLKSTNPFEEDEDGNVITEAYVSSNGVVRMRPRKKRRAPPPPVHKLLSSSNESTGDAAFSTRLKIKESTPLESSEDIDKLTNLTAEIESFVQTTSNDDVTSSSIEQTQSQVRPSPSATSNTEPKLKIVEESEQLSVDKTTEISTLPDKIQEKPVDQPSESSQTEESTAKTNSPIPEPVEQISQLEELKIIEESKCVTAPQPSPRAKPSPPPVPRATPVTEEVDLENVSLPETPVPARRFNKNRTQAQTNGNVLQIIETSSSNTAPAVDEEENMQSKAVKNVNYEFEYKVQPIVTEIDEKIGTARMKISESTGDINSVPTTGGERRRSVRDIIESINKSQSLLKVNQDATGTLHAAQSTDSINRNMRELSERERELQVLINEMDSHFSKQKPAAPARDRGSYYDNVPDDADDGNTDNLLSNSDLRSKKSPTKSLGIETNDEGQFKDCIDWNPLPKPRRSRHFPEPAQQIPVGGSILANIDHNNNGTSKS
ncbi:uncharacterized protein LOC129727165 [Wyeomyia smithii]|uniref:uncharacterized protein LOC129727165 n=1 Tax=Wyeomyia smithii TaxID=174621 RepID=UPI0024681BD1|nr:uncharacterized protein LOC129727165 [Wyeomyia smithii]XP_055540665.1 uncharacterized protein LOC129727165 [Wyeomyia smithii]XP_055540666.1 uncharacterized protein LOC129727165 [Wyeomyia smithii]XP_055540667.1 uncharacterized protein LOC129727165 [Wyeomyia smithii]XP_055540668.1 uncharacterized protein LOC129727165 [Wyeomyia smithii]XP_055540669.1 uncharacterized protein LOC129727165 [Wyeomyia smithii]XP_055540670.1 uncharacterized protein LOC129727165 [Wyeomyia smithii]XP_055540671.1 unc